MADRRVAVRTGAAWTEIPDADAGVMSAVRRKTAGTFSVYDDAFVTTGVYGGGANYAIGRCRSGDA